VKGEEVHWMFCIFI